MVAGGNREVRLEHGALPKSAMQDVGKSIVAYSMVIGMECFEAACSGDNDKSDTKST